MSEYKGSWLSDRWYDFVDWVQPRSTAVQMTLTFVVVVVGFGGFRFCVHPSEPKVVNQEVLLDLDLPIAEDPEQPPFATLRRGDWVMVEACDWIPGDSRRLAGSNGGYWVSVRWGTHRGGAWCDGVRKVTAACKLCWEEPR